MSHLPSNLFGEAAKPFFRGVDLGFDSTVELYIIHDEPCRSRVEPFTESWLARPLEKFMIPTARVALATPDQC
ncbi:hypothetical protein [Sphingomonas sp. ERG5]|uniref:hypothetical protein n=1 Tax=Sphingomonas sp. ERG5 TaxID=1381597 RepID=UPI00054B16C6|nr:hypothetical protein [Sphingomonas sp. ERG5]